MSDYQGWSNSATFLANQYIQQESALYDQIVALHKAGVLTVNTLREVAPVKVNTDEGADCGYVKGVICLDAWTEGTVNWQEMVENWQQDLSLDKSAGHKPTMATSLKEQCFAIISQVIDQDGPGTALQIEYDELSGKCGDKPNDAVWAEFLAALQRERPEAGYEVLYTCPESELKVVRMPNGQLCITDDYQTDYVRIDALGKWVRESDQLSMTTGVKAFLDTLEPAAK